MREVAESYGYLGVFGISLLGSLIPFLPLPYLFVVVILSRTLDPLTLGLVSGIGGAVGKLTSYALGRLGNKLLGTERKRKMESLREFIGRYGDLAVFLFALTPLPDDVYYIPAGLIRMPLWRFMLANAAGKVALATFVAYLGGVYMTVIETTLGNTYGFVVAVAALAVITYVIFKVDWEAFVSHYRTGGLRGVLRNINEVLGNKRR
ncbi:MAG: VTT domain-containing protein [Thaumarchaeota archaeon]|nr:VTT domain-containing protein [Candidatus Calditenuaceae archaeon]MDW8041293.1 VTT domain-containing protein [Nitrososphaerota archaeon]